MLFIGERQGAALHPLKGLLKTSSFSLGANLPSANIKSPLRILKTFKKGYLTIPFLKFFGIQNLSFKKGFGRRRPCPQLTDKPKFEIKEAAMFYLSIPYHGEDDRLPDGYEAKVEQNGTYVVYATVDV